MAADNWIADVLGVGSLFEPDAPDNYYQNAAQGLYDLDKANKKSEIGNELNATEGKASQIAAQQGITGPAAAGLEHIAEQGAQHSGNVAIGDIDAQARKVQYDAMMKDREAQMAQQTAREQALYNLGQKGVGLLGGALKIGGGMGLINSATPFLGGLSETLGNPLAAPKAEQPEGAPMPTDEEAYPGFEAEKIPEIPLV